MTDSFLILTILGAIIAIYSILPEHKKLRVGYSFGRIEKIILVILALIIILSSLSASFISLHYEKYWFPVNGFNLKVRFVIELLQAISAIAILGMFLYKLLKKKVSIKNEKYFTEKIDELFNEERYTSVLALIDENYETLLNSEDAESKKILLENTMTKLLDYEFVNQLIKFRPYLGLRIVTDKEQHIFFKKKFTELYFKALLKNKGGILYKEIGNNQNFYSPYRYDLPENNKIIHTIFSDINLAKELNVWKPVGDAILDLLDEQYRRERDIYNEYQKEFIEESDGLFNDPLFVGIRFFDIMIREAIYQKTNWHMWLFYYSPFVDRICRNYRIDKYSQPEAEFPNVYSRSLHEIISNLRDWISLIEKDTENVEQKLERVDCNHENDNIIKSSVLCLAECIQSILNTDSIPDKFKEDLTHIVFELYFDLALSNKETPRKYAEILVSCILRGIYSYGKKDGIYKELLVNYLESLDKQPILRKNGGPEKLEKLRSRLNNS